MAYGSNTITVTSVTLKQSQRRRRKRPPSNEELAKRLAELERTYEIVIDAIEQLMKPPVRKRNQIGFRPRTLTK